jgi:hypothetical protein
LHPTEVYARTNEIPDLVISLDASATALSDILPKAWAGIRKWAILGETEVVVPQNWDPHIQAQFDRLFTWRDSWIDNERFFRLNLPNAIDSPRSELSVPDRFCTMIAGNKRSRHPLELYAKRREAIRWFERHHPDHFDLYGLDWDVLIVGGPRPLRALNVLLPTRTRRLLAPRFPSYRGPVATKGDVLSRYRFTICFENARDIEGYITEKLFDCLLAGTIPVYWGAPNITDHVPANCFIDFRDFASYEELYEHLTSLSTEARAKFRQAGQAFLRSDRATPFSTEHWVETLLSHLD